MEQMLKQWLQTFLEGLISRREHSGERMKRFEIGFDYANFWGVPRIDTAAYSR